MGGVGIGGWEAHVPFETFSNNCSPNIFPCDQWLLICVLCTECIPTHSIDVNTREKKPAIVLR